MSDPLPPAHREIVATAPTHGAHMAKRRAAKARSQNRARGHKRALTAKHTLKGVR